MAQKPSSTEPAPPSRAENTGSPSTRGTHPQTKRPARSTSALTWQFPTGQRSREASPARSGCSCGVIASILSSTSTLTDDAWRANFLRMVVIIRITNALRRIRYIQVRSSASRFSVVVSPSPKASRKNVRQGRRTGYRAHNHRCAHRTGDEAGYADNAGEGHMSFSPLPENRNALARFRGFVSGLLTIASRKVIGRSRLAAFSVSHSRASSRVTGTPALGRTCSSVSSIQMDCTDFRTKLIGAGSSTIRLCRARATPRGGKGRAHKYLMVEKWDGGALGRLGFPVPSALRADPPHKQTVSWLHESPAMIYMARRHHV